MARAVLLSSVVVATLALGACGDQESDESAVAPTPVASSSPASNPASSPASSPSPVPTPGPSTAGSLPATALPTALPTTPPSVPTDSFKRVRVSGTITLRGGCVVMIDDNGVEWDLDGPGTDTLTEGQSIVVTGRSVASEETGCGAPLVVTTIQTRDR